MGYSDSDIIVQCEGCEHPLAGYLERGFEVEELNIEWTLCPIHVLSVEPGVYVYEL